MHRISNENIKYVLINQIYDLVRYSLSRCSGEGWGGGQSIIEWGVESLATLNVKLNILVMSTPYHFVRSIGLFRGPRGSCTDNTIMYPLELAKHIWTSGIDTPDV
jgi:hypothetical protein